MFAPDQPRVGSRRLVPESDQLWRGPDGSRWHCDEKSASRLPTLSTVLSCAANRVILTGMATSLLSTSRVIDLNGWLVAAGWAVASRKYSRDYVSDEDEARLSKRGIWSRNFDLPFDWRAAKCQQQP
jgi:hypothetical protein